MHIRIIVFGCLVALSTSTRTCPAEEPSAQPSPADEAKRLEQVAAGVRRARAQSRGAVYQPTKRSGTAPFTIVFRSFPLIEAAQVYADISGQEVMMSVGVAKSLVTLKCERQNTSEALITFDTGFREAGIRIVEITPKIVALVALEK